MQSLAYKDNHFNYIGKVSRENKIKNGIPRLFLGKRYTETVLKFVNDNHTDFWLKK